MSDLPPQDVARRDADAKRIGKMIMIAYEEAVGDLPYDPEQMSECMRLSVDRFNAELGPFQATIREIDKGRITMALTKRRAN